MRLVAWNCNGALHRKFEALLALEPDIAVVSECADPEVLGRKCSLPVFSAPPVWTGGNRNRGLAVFFFNESRGCVHGRFRTDLQWVAPVEIHAPRRFNLLAVLAHTFGLRKAEAGPVNEALAFYRQFLTGEDAVLAGDFNHNVIWDKRGWASNHRDTVDALDGCGLVSAYHAATGQPQGEEGTATIYWRDRRKDGPTYHIDYIFIPRTWAARPFDLRVESFENWVGEGLSDHVPLVLDIPNG